MKELGLLRGLTPGGTAYETPAMAGPAGSQTQRAAVAPEAAAPVRAKKEDLHVQIEAPLVFRGSDRTRTTTTASNTPGSPAKPNAIKNAIYECGNESKGDAWVQFRSAYYLYAIIFLIFDVEAIFLLPFAVAFTGLGLGACAAMLVFVLLLAEGLAWAWAKGVLNWSA